MKDKRIKLKTEAGKWIVDEGYKKVEFDTLRAAWLYIFCLKEIRPNAPRALKSYCSVDSLIPAAPKKLVRVSLQN